MEADLLAAIVAGVAGGVVMIAARWGLRLAGVPLQMDVAMMWGTMFKLEGTAAYGVGWGVHLMMSVLIGLVYAWGFALLGVSAETAWLWGLLGGLIHWAIAGMMMGVLPAMHPRIPGEQPAPGFMVSNFGSAGVSAFLVGHLLYGLAFAVAYTALHGAL